MRAVRKTTLSPEARRREGKAAVALICAAAVSGAWALGTGTSFAHAVVALHAAITLGALTVALRTRDPRVRLLLAAAVAASAALGVLHALGWRDALRLHLVVGVAAPIVSVVAVLLVRRTAVRIDPLRRRLLRAGIGGAAAVAGGAALDATLRFPGLPGSDRRFTGSFPRSGRPPATRWLDDDPPRADATTWTVIVEGHGGHTTWHVDDLARLASRRVHATLDCTSGWYTTNAWTGVALDDLFDASGVRPGGRSIMVKSSTGYARWFPRSDARHLVLATGLDDAQLLPGNGYPVRLVAPGRRGFWWVKWVRRVSISDRPSWWQPPFPLT